MDDKTIKQIKTIYTSINRYTNYNELYEPYSLDKIIMYEKYLETKLPDMLFDFLTKISRTIYFSNSAGQEVFDLHLIPHPFHKMHVEYNNTEKRYYIKREHLNKCVVPIGLNKHVMILKGDYAGSIWVSDTYNCYSNIYILKYSSFKIYLKSIIHWFKKSSIGKLNM